MNIENDFDIVKSKELLPFRHIASPLVGKEVPIIALVFDAENSFFG